MAAPQPRDGGVLRVAIDTDPQCLDPQQAGNNNSLNIGRQITDSLTDQRPDTGELVPWLATHWEVSEDNTAFTFHLREGATFSDGAPIDAAAVRADLEGIVKLGARASLRLPLRHVLPNAAIPLLTMAGIITGNLLAGSVVTETVFSRDGVGRGSPRRPWR
jgi:ABC-type transport system substrate-binding protein